ncbi:MAG: hypothetical protein EU529_05115 [Promethearchaeota archaeon]|nr:MAG: hypothetical protein EU529_05115 [Candidatus Lokiarchaeota archaeon]
MTEKIKKSFDFKNILVEIEKFNPHCTREEIIKSIGSHITDIYYTRVNELGLKDKLDRFARKKLLLQRSRQAKKAQVLTDSKIKKDEMISEYKGIKSILTGLSKSYAYNNAYFDTREIDKFSDSDSSDFMINGESVNLLKDKDDLLQASFKPKLEEDLKNIDRESKSSNSLIKEDIELYDQTVVIEGLETEPLFPLEDEDVSLIDNFDESFFFNNRQYQTLKDEIYNSRKHILSLGENWNGEGSKAFNLEVWRFASDFLINFFYKFNLRHSLNLKVPNILPVGDLSIDIHWKTEEMELTINFSEEFLNLPSFYGKDNKNNEIQGIIDIDKIHTVIFPWLKNFR